MRLSQQKLADMVEAAPNYIAMIEAGKRFPTDKMLEKIASALQKEPCDLFSSEPIQKDWQEEILAELEDVIERKLKAMREE